MPYRTGTYVAFDGLDEKNPTKSDFKYFATLKAWDKNNDIDFEFVDSHEKTDAVRDSSKKETLKKRIQERLSRSKNIIIIISSETRDIGSMLSYEIELAVETYKLPLIITYVDYKKILNPKSHSSEWPKALLENINNGKAKAIHIPFKKEPILDAISQFGVNDKFPSSALSYYYDYVYKGWGID